MWNKKKNKKKMYRGDNVFFGFIQLSKNTIDIFCVEVPVLKISGYRFSSVVKLFQEL